MSIVSAIVGEASSTCEDNRICFEQTADIQHAVAAAVGLLIVISKIIWLNRRESHGCRRRLCESAFPVTSATASNKKIHGKSIHVCPLQKTACFSGWITRFINMHTVEYNGTVDALFIVGWEELVYTVDTKLTLLEYIVRLEWVSLLPVMADRLTTD